MSQKIFAIGDIHGCAAELKLLLKKLPLTPDSTIIFLGDYIDRGDSSKEVLDIVMNLRNDYNVIPLIGNHEQMFLHFIYDLSSAEASNFLFNGGTATLASYANRHGEYVILEEHIEFLKSMKIWHETEDYFFVHAGVPPGKTLDKLDFEMVKYDLTTIREEFLDSDFDWGKKIIHGHTPVREPEVEDNRINVDTACVFDGKLTAVSLPDGEFYSVDKIAPYQHTYLRDHTSSRRAVRFELEADLIIFKDDRVMKFKTLNFSDFGMLITEETPSGKDLFKENEILKGDLGENNESIPFEAKVVRKFESDNKFHYALEFVLSPFEAPKI